MNNKMEELLGMTKLADFLSKRADEEKKSRFLWIMAIIGAVAAIAVAAYFIYKFGIDITLFLNVNSDWKTAHRTDHIVAGMTERYITSIAQRLPAAVTSYSDFVLINTQKVGRRAPCGEIRGNRAFFVIFKAHPGNALAFLRTKKIHFALVLLVGQFVYIYKKCQCHYFAYIF